MKVNHPEGMPDACSEECSRNNEHLGDAPSGFVCAECGGSAMCYPTCVEPYRGRAYEPWEGRTGAQEMMDDYA